MLGRKTKIAAGFAAVAALMLPMSAANAAPQDLEFTNTAGSVQIGSLDPLETAAGNAGLTGTWDDETGDFTGTTTFNPVTIDAAPPDVPVAVVVQLDNEDDNVTGTIDPETGEAELTATMTFVLQIPSLTTTCTSAPFDVAFTSTEPFDPIPFEADADYTISLEGDFTILPFDVTTGCDPSNAVVAGLINDTLGLNPDGGAGTATLDLVRGTPAPPTTPTTSATTTTTAATVAATSAPRFAG